MGYPGVPPGMPPPGMPPFAVSARANLLRSSLPTLLSVRDLLRSTPDQPSSPFLIIRPR
jgi:hypothetical protein